MSRRFGRNQKRKLRAIAGDALAMARRAQDSYDRAAAEARRRESDLLDFVHEVEHLIGDLRHSSLREPERIQASATYAGRLEILQRARRDRFASPAMREAAFLTEAPLYARLVLHELRTLVERDYQHNLLHVTVEHDSFGARYFLTERALAVANPLVFDTMVATVSRDLVRKLVEAVRLRQSTAASAAQQEK